MEMNWEGLLVSVLVCFIVDPFLFSTLRRLEVYDHPNRRSIHESAVLTMGGILILTGYCAGLLYLLYTQSIPLDQDSFTLFVGILAGAFCMAILGALDDLLDLKPTTKFVFESLVALMMCHFGLLMSSINFFGFHFDLGILSYPFTILWIVGIINAVNFMDGLDGLAGGICLIIFLTLSLSTQTSPLSGYFLPGLMGGITIFLLRNSYPASIYMGDVGSLFLGFHIAVFSLLVFPFDHPVCGSFGLLTLLGVPLLDTAMAIFRRAYGKKILFHADRAHIHHVLFQKINHRNAVGLLYGVSSLLSIFLVLSLKMDKSLAQPFLLIGALLILGTLILYVYWPNQNSESGKPLIPKN